MQIHRSLHDYHLAEFWKWAMATAIGMIMGLLAFLTDLGIETMNDVKYTTTESRMQRGGSTCVIVFVCVWWGGKGMMGGHAALVVMI